MLHLPAAVFLGWRLLSADPGEGGELKKETAFGPQLSSPLVEFTFRAGMSGWLRLPGGGVDGWSSSTFRPAVVTWKAHLPVEGGKASVEI